MDDLVSPHQNAFIKGRTISDNIILNSEILGTVTKNKKGKGTLGALKLDLDKAYDRLSWRFIKTVMECMGFIPHWINLIQECLSSISYQFIINGGQSGSFVPQRGLRQGDSLSPYIFILCQNILSMLLFEAESCNKI